MRLVVLVFVPNDWNCLSAWCTTLGGEFDGLFDFESAVLPGRFMVRMEAKRVGLKKPAKPSKDVPKGHIDGKRNKPRKPRPEVQGLLSFHHSLQTVFDFSPDEKKPRKMQ